MTTVLEVELADGPRDFTLVGLPRDEWAELVHQHPSEDPRWQYDADTLHPQLVRRCVTDPILSLDLAASLVDDTDAGVDLVEACLRLTVPGSLEWAHRRLATDARLLAEVAAAVRMGIPHAQFAAWPATSQDLALAWIETQADVCPGCGIPAADMSDPYAWEADGRQCWSCDDLERARQEIPEEHRHHVHFRPVRSGV